MIQFRWKRVPDLGGLRKSEAFTKGLNIVEVDGKACVLQYKLHFVPILITDRVPSYSLKTGRECDTQWRDVTIELTPTT